VTRQRLPHAIIVPCFALLVNTMAAKADQFVPRPFPPSGATVTIMVQDYQGWNSGSIIFPPSNVVSGTFLNAVGFAEPLSFLGASPGGNWLYSIIFNLHPEYSGMYAASKPVSVSIGFPSSVNGTQPLHLYWTSFLGGTSPPHRQHGLGPCRGQSLAT